ncbi:MAG: hypothetical protein ABI460_08550 [Caldimonas sp.]
MSKVDLPDSMSTAVWDKHKKELGKDKAVLEKVQKELAKVTQAAKSLQDAHSAASFDLLDPKGLATPAAANLASTKLEAAANGDFKKMVTAAKDALDAANDFQNAVDKAGKGLKGDIAKAATAASAAASTASKASAKFISEVNAAVAAARSKLEEAVKAAKPAPVAPAAKANPKTAADAKVLATLIKKSIALLKSPKGSPVPVRFLVLVENKKLRLYLGPKPENGLAKLKTQFDPKAKFKRIRDPKGQVIWEKASLTFVSDILKGALAKQVQIAVREQTRVSVKVRVKKSDGSVEEAENVPDLTDDQLKVDPADEAEMLAAGKEFASRLAELQPDIAAYKGPNAQKIKALVATIKSNGAAKKYAELLDELDELESLLDGGDESEGDEAEGEETGGVPPAKAFLAKLGALRSKIDAAVAAGGATAKQIKDYAEGAEKLAKTEVAANVDKANAVLNKVEQMLGDLAKAGTGGLSVAKLATARLEWVSTRDAAIKEITVLSKAIVAAFAKETSQAPQVKAAITKLAGLTVRLKSGLDNDLDAALSENDPGRRVALAARAKASLASIRKFVEEDELMSNLDNNEIVKTMSVVGPMKKSLSAIEAALG